MESNSGSKPDLRLSPRARELLDLESRVTAGGFDRLSYFFENRSRISVMGESDERKKI